MIRQAYVVKHESVLYLCLTEEEPVSAHVERDGHLTRETVFVAGPEEPDPTGREPGLHPTWDRIADRAPSARWDGERQVLGPVVERWRRPTGCGVGIYAMPESGVPRPDVRRTDIDDVRISDWARGIIIHALTQACTDLWVLGCMQPETPGDVQELWERHVVAVSKSYLST